MKNDKVTNLNEIKKQAMQTRNLSAKKYHHWVSWLNLSNIKINPKMFKIAAYLRISNEAVITISITEK